MSLPVQFNHPTAAAISDSSMLPIHDYNPKIYVACRNVAVQTEEIRGEELHEAEVVRDGDIFLKVFYNASGRYGETPPDHYGSERYWLTRHERKKIFYLDVSDYDGNDYENVDYNNIYKLRSPIYPKSVVWRKCANAKLFDFKAVFENVVSGLQARDIGIQTIPEQVGDDSFYTDEDLFNEIIDDAIFTNDDDSALFADDVVEWGN